MTEEQELDGFGMPTHHNEDKQCIILFAYFVFGISIPMIIAIILELLK